MFWRHIDDLCAGVLIVGCLVAILCGIDGQAWGILGVAAGWCMRKGGEAGKNAVKRDKKTGP